MKLSAINPIISKSVIENAIELLPVENTVPFLHLRAPHIYMTF